MKNPNRSKLIRSAASFPKGSKERRALLTKLANSDWDDYMMVENHRVIPITQASPESIQKEIKRARVTLQKVRDITKSILAIPLPTKSTDPMEYVAHQMDYLASAEEHADDLKFVFEDWHRGV